MQLLTANGYPLLECTSALIKLLRRGDEGRALFFALEIETRFPFHVWKRLRIFAAEDIGLADPTAIVTVNALAESWAAIKERAPKDVVVEQDFLVMAVLICARAPKHREVDTAKCYVLERRAKGWREPVPDFALDCHTGRGRAMGKTELGWWQDTDYLPPGAFGRYEHYQRLKAAGGELPTEQP